MRLRCCPIVAIACPVRISGKWKKVSLATYLNLTLTAYVYCCTQASHKRLNGFHFMGSNAFSPHAERAGWRLQFSDCSAWCFPLSVDILWLPIATPAKIAWVRILSRHHTWNLKRSNSKLTHFMISKILNSKDLSESHLFSMSICKTSWLGLRKKCWTIHTASFSPKRSAQSSWHGY